MSAMYRRQTSPFRTIAHLGVGVVSTILLSSPPAAARPDSRACDQLPRDAFRDARHLHGGPHQQHRHRGHHQHHKGPPIPPPPPTNPGIPGIDSLANFDLSFTAPGFAADGSALPWFQPGQPSTAIDASFSYPDETLLTAPAPLLPPACQ